MSNVLLRAVVLLLFLATEPAAALRVVSLAPSVTETLFAIGAGQEIVGVSTQCDHPPEALRIDRVGTFLQPNLEAVLEKRPDLVIAAPSPANAPILATFERLHIEVLLVEANSIAENLSNILRIAESVDRGEAGHALVRQIQHDIAAIERRLIGVTPRRVLLVLGRKPFIVAGAGGLQDELIRVAGGINVAAAAPGLWPRLSFEHVIEQRPEVVVDMTIPHQQTAAGFLGIWNEFPTVPAVRSGQVYGHSPPLLVRPGPRVAEAIELLARYLHPERFEGTISDAY